MRGGEKRRQHCECWATIATEKRKLGTLPAAECDRSIFAAMEVWGMGDKSCERERNQVYRWCCWNHRINGRLFPRGEPDNP